MGSVPFDSGSDLRNDFFDKPVHGRGRIGRDQVQDEVGGAGVDESLDRGERCVQVIEVDPVLQAELNLIWAEHRNDYVCTPENRISRELISWYRPSWVTRSSRDPLSDVRT